MSCCRILVPWIGISLVSEVSESRGLKRGGLCSFDYYYSAEPFAPAFGELKISLETYEVQSCRKRFEGLAAEEVNKKMALKLSRNVFERRS